MERILIVEDSESIRDVLAEACRLWGYETQFAENGEEGLEKFRSESFSLIITDIRMPVMDGLTMLKTIKKEDAKTPILVITGYPTVDSAVESLVHGADYYIVKPINMTDLETKIKKALDKRRLIRSLESIKLWNALLLIFIPVWIILGYILAQVIR